MELTTCQICERGLTANKKYQGNRILSHHGFTRPGDGWLHGACFGAKQRPYEDACDAIPPYIESVKNYRKGQEDLIERYKTTPPDTITIPSFSRRSEPLVFTKPEGFDPTANHSYSNRYRDYEGAWLGRIKDAEYSIVKANREVERMEKRLQAWKPQ